MRTWMRLPASASIRDGFVDVACASAEYAGGITVTWTRCTGWPARSKWQHLHDAARCRPDERMRRQAECRYHQR
jgi:hypothetical protein